MKKIKCLIGIIGLLFSTGAYALNPDNALVTDRPDAAEASEVVGKGRFQLETSFGFGYNKQGVTKTRTYNTPTLFRFGLGESWELRVESEMLQWQTQTGSAKQTGFTDLAIGFKQHFFDNEGWRPSSGLLVHLGLPTGSSAFSASDLEPVIKFLNDWDLPAGFGLGTNIGLDVPANVGANRFARFLYAFAVGHDIPGTKGRLGMFVELAGDLPLRKGQAKGASFDTGLTFLVSENIQVDTVFQIGLNENTDDLVSGLGLSWRF